VSVNEQRRGDGVRVASQYQERRVKIVAWMHLEERRIRDGGCNSRELADVTATTRAFSR
jgi:hypothetical protein